MMRLKPYPKSLKIIFPEVVMISAVVTTLLLFKAHSHKTPALHYLVSIFYMQ